MLLLLVLRILLFCSMIRFITSISHTNILSGYIYIYIYSFANILFNSSSSLNDASVLWSYRIRMLSRNSIEIARAYYINKALPGSWVGRKN